MPNVRPTIPNAYLCTAFKMPSSKSEFIVEFSPNSSQHTAHHLLIFGCDRPGWKEFKRTGQVWDCGKLVDQQPGYPRERPCSPGSQILYTWSMDAPTTKLPEGVGFKVGKGTGINYLVLQVHYLHVDKFIQGSTDNSGVMITTLPGYSKRVTKTAGLYLLGTGHGTIQPHEEKKVRNSLLTQRDCGNPPICISAPHSCTWNNGVWLQDRQRRKVAFNRKTQPARASGVLSS